MRQGMTKKIQSERRKNITKLEKRETIDVLLICFSRFFFILLFIYLLLYLIKYVECVLLCNLCEIICALEWQILLWQNCPTKNCIAIIFMEIIMFSRHVNQKLVWLNCCFQNRFLQYITISNCSMRFPAFRE